MKKIPLTKPYISQEVKDEVLEVLDSGYLTEGSVTKQFEEAVPGQCVTTSLELLGIHFSVE